MYKLCKTEQSTKRQRELEKILLSAMQGKAYEDISVSELCDANGIPRKAFYRYFDSKDGALQALIYHTLLEFEPFSETYVTSSPKSVHSDLEKFYSFWYQNADLLFAITRNELDGMLLKCTLDFTFNDALSFEKYLPGESKWMQGQIVRFAICGLITSVFDWYKSGFKTSINDMAVAAVRMLAYPLFPTIAHI